MILRQVFSSKFAEVAMMMHVNAAKDEMTLLAEEFKILQGQSGLDMPSFDRLMCQFIPGDLIAEHLEQVKAG